MQNGTEHLDEALSIPNFGIDENEHAELNIVADLDVADLGNEE
eukprot:CAMPEP_0202979036 /NCGR_PEP_ID=MMETSP1396-20130829/85301_1 /ASSEMBLY_ACC=CAM_ASM_000872 /TAXON_ID= /ORGANISM="Pseudokeronopsis sp., Strain Brazil" /LENGTH=42 /DNA_ID= /DNA_START= /DNA_END= /DNA_ORIENTATION=